MHQRIQNILENIEKSGEKVRNINVFLNDPGTTVVINYSKGEGRQTEPIDLVRRDQLDQTLNTLAAGDRAEGSGVLFGDVPQQDRNHEPTDSGHSSPNYHDSCQINEVDCQYPLDEKKSSFPSDSAACYSWNVVNSNSSEDAHQVSVRAADGSSSAHQGALYAGNCQWQDDIAIDEYKKESGMSNDTGVSIHNCVKHSKRENSISEEPHSCKSKSKVMVKLYSEEQYTRRSSFSEYISEPIEEEEESELEELDKDYRDYIKDVLYGIKAECTREEFAHKIRDPTRNKELYRVVQSDSKSIYPDDHDLSYNCVFDDIIIAIHYNEKNDVLYHGSFCKLYGTWWQYVTITDAIVIDCAHPLYHRIIQTAMEYVEGNLQNCLQHHPLPASPYPNDGEDCGAADADYGGKKDDVDQRDEKYDEEDDDGDMDDDEDDDCDISGPCAIAQRDAVNSDIFHHGLKRAQKGSLVPTHKISHATNDDKDDNVDHGGGDDDDDSDISGPCAIAERDAVDNDTCHHGSKCAHKGSLVPTRNILHATNDDKDDNVGYGDDDDDDDQNDDGDVNVSLDDYASFLRPLIVQEVVDSVDGYIYFWLYTRNHPMPSSSISSSISSSSSSDDDDEYDGDDYSDDESCDDDEDEDDEEEEDDEDEDDDEEDDDDDDADHGVAPTAEDDEGYNDDDCSDDDGNNDGYDIDGDNDDVVDDDVDSAGDVENNDVDDNFHGGDDVDDENDDDDDLMIWMMMMMMLPGS